MNNIGAIILAAGEGTRMKSSKSKVLCEILFKPMINWVVDSCKSIGCNETDICIICPESKDDICNVTDNKLKYVIQKEKLGTGHAIMQAREFLDNVNKDDILIMLGDAPFISSQVLMDSYNEHVSQKNELTVLSASLQNPFGYGRIIRNNLNNNLVINIKEEVDCSYEERLISEVNSGVMWFKRDRLLKILDKIKNNNSKGEYYITSAVSILFQLGDKIGAYNCNDETVVLGANTRYQLMKMNDIARMKVIEKLANNGVEFISSEGVIISDDVVIGSETTIYSGVTLRGKTIIGNNCMITSGSYINNSEIGNNTVIKSCYIDNSVIGKNVQLGPFSNVRPNCTIGDNVKIGDFVEMKNSIIGKKTSIAHLTYVGDSDVGNNVNFGCGCVTVNYNGKNKYKTIIEDNCFIGCNTNLVAPVKIGRNSYTAAGSTITNDVPDNSLCIARSRQIIKENWKIRD